jgi:hypothetical protein
MSQRDISTDPEYKVKREWYIRNRAASDARSKKWKSENPKRVRETNAKYQARKKDIILKAKDKPCAECGVKYPPCVMDFHHVKGKKSFSIAARRTSTSPAKLVSEIAKCIVLCANCHRLRTHRERGSDPKFLVLKQGH